MKPKVRALLEKAIANQLPLFICLLIHLILFIFSVEIHRGMHKSKVMILKNGCESNTQVTRGI